MAKRSRWTKRIHYPLLIWTDLGQPAQTVRFLISEHKFMEYLDRRETKKALSVLRNELAPLNHNPERLHQLSR